MLATLLTTFWYALTLALHTHTAHARDAGRDGTTVGAAGDGLYYIFGSKVSIPSGARPPRARTPPPFGPRQVHVQEPLRSNSRGSVGMLVSTYKPHPCASPDDPRSSAALAFAWVIADSWIRERVAESPREDRAMRICG